MKDLPIVAKGVINIILYIIYLLLASIVFSILFPLVMQALGQDVLNPNNPIFVKIQYFIAILVLLVSLVFRKYFYISCKTESEVVFVEESSYTTKKKAVTKNKKTKSTKDDEDIKIYVDKEIK